MAKDNVIQTYNINSQEVFPRVLIDSVVSDDGKESGASVIGKSLEGTDLYIRNLTLNNKIMEGDTPKSYVNLKTLSDTTKSGVTLDIVTVNSDSDQKSYLNINDKRTGGSCNFNGYFNDSLIRNTGYIDVSAKKLIVNANEDGIDASAAKIRIDTSSITGTTGDVSMNGGNLKMKYTDVSIGKISQLQFVGDSVISSSNKRGIKMESKNASIDVSSSIELDSNIVTINSSDLSINKIDHVLLDCSSAGNCMATLLDISVDMNSEKITTNAELLCNKLRQLGTQTTYNTYVTRSIENKKVPGNTNISTNINTEYRDNFKIDNDKFDLDIKRIYDASIGYSGNYKADWSYKFAVNDDVYFKIDNDSLRGKVNNQNDVLLGMPIGSIVMWMKPNKGGSVNVPKGWMLMEKKPMLISRKFYTCELIRNYNEYGDKAIYYYYNKKYKSITTGKEFEHPLYSSYGGEQGKCFSFLDSSIPSMPDNTRKFMSSIPGDFLIGSDRFELTYVLIDNMMTHVTAGAGGNYTAKLWDSTNNKNRNIYTRITPRVSGVAYPNYENEVLTLFYNGVTNDDATTSKLAFGTFECKWYYLDSDAAGINDSSLDGTSITGIVGVETYIIPYIYTPTTYSYIMKVE